jgi:hypothetical protein
MRVKVFDPATTADLVAALQARVDAIVSRVGDDELEVSLLGSRGSDADHAELAARVEAWGGAALVVQER